MGDAENGGGPTRLPSKEEILEMIDAMTDVGEEEKERLKAEIFGGGEEGARGGPAGGLPARGGGSATPEIAMVLLLFLIVAALIGVIAVVLIKRERDREMKRKLGKKSRKEEVAGKKKTKTGKAK